MKCPRCEGKGQVKILAIYVVSVIILLLMTLKRVWKELSIIHVLIREKDGHLCAANTASATLLAAEDKDE